MEAGVIEIKQGTLVWGDEIVELARIVDIVSGIQQSVRIGLDGWINNKIVKIAYEVLTVK